MRPDDRAPELGVTEQNLHNEVDAPPDKGTGADFRLITDADEVGMSTTLFFAVPLLRVLIQAVAESEGESTRMMARLASGAWVGVEREADGDTLLVSSGGGDGFAGSGQHGTQAAMAEHGFETLANGDFVRRLTFETDDAFVEIATLLIGTLQHIWGASLREAIEVSLHLSLPA